jgi:hypothetical protein
MAPAPAGAGQVIPSRAQLEYLLNGQGTLDEFETFDIPDDSSVVLGVSQLTDTSVVLGQGPGLVNPGATYTSIRAPLSWMGAYYNGLPMSKTILAWNPTVEEQAFSPQLFFAVYIIYNVPVQLVGADLIRFGDVGLVTVEVYDTAGEFVEEVIMDLTDVGLHVFFGYRHDPGIGSIVIKNMKFPALWSPNVDDHVYGVVDTTPAGATTWGRVKSLYLR